MNDLFLSRRYDDDPDSERNIHLASLAYDDNDYGWNEPSDLASDCGRFTLTVSFDISDVLSDEVMYAELAASLAVQCMKASVHVRAVELADEGE